MPVLGVPIAGVSAGETVHERVRDIRTRGVGRQIKTVSKRERQGREKKPV